MDVICHQAVSVKRNLALLRVLPQPVEIKLAIVIREEYRLPVNATLDNVLRDSSKMNARAAGHC